MTLGNVNELERRLPLALAILRITTGIFFLYWAVEKFVRPDVNARIWDYFFRISISVNFSYVIGAVNTVLAIAMIVGFKRRITYGYWLLFHTLSVVSTYRELIHPYTSNNHLFLAGVPIIFIMLALYMLRDWDTQWVVGGR
jgi:uncharacterized membrane protein YphA (DoxX/SURF4 family)